jgi:XTP/dITP diphosphohydrolase
VKELLFVTGNKDKFADAKQILSSYELTVVQKKLPLEEIQHTDGQKIALHKAQQAFHELGQPLFVNDTIWMIPALHNFPGAFMKYINDCFDSSDWLRLMDGVTDRRIIMREVLVYIDATQQKILYNDIEGIILHEASGKDGVQSDRIVSFSGDGISIAEARDNGRITTASKLGKTSYDLLGEWLSL